MEASKVPLPGVVYHAGFPNAAEDSAASAQALSLDQLVIQQPASTYFWQLDGSGIPEAGLHPGTILVVDRAKTPRHGDWVVAVIDEEFSLRSIQRTAKGVRLFTAAGVQDEHKRAVLWGVVTYSVRQMRNSA